MVVARKSIVGKDNRYDWALETNHRSLECKYRRRETYLGEPEDAHAHALVVLGGKPGRRSHFACCQ